MKISKLNYEQLLPSLRQASKELKGGERRRFLGQLVLDIGLGGQRLVSETLGVGRDTLRKGIQELQSGIIKSDNFSQRGRFKTEDKHPAIGVSIREIVDEASQIDPQFKSTRLYTRLSAPSLRKELLNRGYKKSEIPCDGTLCNIMKRLGYKRRKVEKTKPKKK